MYILEREEFMCVVALTVCNHARPNAENSGNYHGTAGQPSPTPSIENEGEERVGG